MHKRLVGTVVRGLRTPIFVEGDDISSALCEVVSDCVENGDFKVEDGDILSITESVVARCQGNYADIEEIRKDLKNKLPAECKSLLLLFPITSRNRFSILLRAFAGVVPQIILYLSYPQDEVGNPVVDIESLKASDVDLLHDVFTEEEFKEKFGEFTHPFTGINYFDFYRDIIEGENAECKILLGNDVAAAARYAEDILCCDIHSRKNSVKILRSTDARTVLSLADLMNEPVDGSGYCPEYGLLGSNKAGETNVKLFPRDCQEIVDKIAADLAKKFNKKIEVMIYGDGAFKDPQYGIWELADPVVSPAYTQGLAGSPSEVKIKYLADNEYGDLPAEERRDHIIDCIRQKAQMPEEEASSVSEGTTPRKITDLLGSLSDLTSGSGDKGTPVVYIQNYIDNYAADNE